MAAPIFELYPLSTNSQIPKFSALESKKLTVGVTGSSAPQLVLVLSKALEYLEEIRVHLVISKDTNSSTEADLGITSSDLAQIGMALIPCSMLALAAAAIGYTPDLLTRASDACLMVCRRLWLVTRESPLNLIHIRNMETVILADERILPPVPAFHHRPKTVEDLFMQPIGKISSQIDISHDLFHHLSGLSEKGN